ncbi:DUF488 family protein [Flavobacterium sp. GT2N3]|uniref:DUF488 family protein n=1 Tax=unclassified Flavobacterium TaxID=196869 RepID=UPI003AAC4D6B
MGHLTSSVADFSGMLYSFEIKILADIRCMPHSRKFPQFDQDSLKQLWKKLELPK